MPGDFLTTKQKPYRLMRDTVSAAETDLAAATKTWASFMSVNHPDQGSSGFAVELAPDENKVVICFDFKNADTDTCGFSLYAYVEGGPAEFVCSVDAVTAGDQQSDMLKPSATRYYGDTVGTITQRFIGGSGAVTEVDSAGNNGVAKIQFDAVGYKYLLLLITAVSASDNVRAFIRGY